MIVTVTGIGLWAPGLTGWSEFRQQLALDGPPADAEFYAPRPAAIAPRERRRAGLTINLAVEVMHQACDMAAVDKAAIATVFASAMGDTDITDYMCRKLAGEDRMLSPTKFHNSVHNATSGYWSISAHNRAPSSFVGGFRDSFACALLEAAACAIAEDLPVGLAGYDIANKAPLHDVLPISQSLGLALVILPGERHPGWPLTLSLDAERSAAAPQPRRAGLARLAVANPMGSGLTLLEALADGSTQRLCWPLGTGTSLQLTPGAWNSPL